jgi:hypothetical protein
MDGPEKLLKLYEKYEPTNYLRKLIILVFCGRAMESRFRIPLVYGCFSSCVSSDLTMV